MDLLFGYPAIVLGLVAGLVAARRGWPATPLVVAGAIALLILVVHQSTVPGPVISEGHGIPAYPEHVFTAPLWVLLALVNAGSWALGIGMGVALAQVTHRPGRLG